MRHPWGPWSRWEVESLGEETHYIVCHRIAPVTWLGFVRPAETQKQYADGVPFLRRHEAMARAAAMNGVSWDGVNRRKAERRRKGPDMEARRKRDAKALKRRRAK